MSNQNVLVLPVQNLTTAIENGMKMAAESDLAGLHKPIPGVCAEHVTDFLAQKFCAAMMTSDPVMEEKLHRLFEACTGRRVPK